MRKGKKRVRGKRIQKIMVFKKMGDEIVLADILTAYSSRKAEWLAQWDREREKCLAKPDSLPTQYAPSAGSMFPGSNPKVENGGRARDKNSWRNFGRKALHKNHRRHPDLRTPPKPDVMLDQE